ITPQLLGLSKAAKLPYASSLCGACREVCPVKIDIPRLLLHLRAEIVEGTTSGSAAHHGPVKRSTAERLVFRLYSITWTRAGSYELGVRLLRMLQRLIVRNERIGKAGNFVSWMLPPLSAWTAWRDARPISGRTFREQWRDMRKDGDK